MARYKLHDPFFDGYEFHDPRDDSATRTVVRIDPDFKERHGTAWQQMASIPTVPVERDKYGKLIGDYIVWVPDGTIMGPFAEPIDEAAHADFDPHVVGGKFVVPVQQAPEMTLEDLGLDMSISWMR